MQWGGALNLFDASTQSPMMVRTFGSFDGVVPPDAAWLGPAILKAVEAAAAAMALASLVSLESKKDDIARAALASMAPQLQAAGASGTITINMFSFSEEDMTRLQQAAAQAVRAKMAARAAAAAPPPQQQPAGPAPGANVLVQWSDGNRYPGIVREHRGDSLLVAFPNGTETWVPAMYFSSS